MRLGEILAARAFTLVQIGNRVEPDAVDTGGHPKIAHFQHGSVHSRIVEI